MKKLFIISILAISITACNQGDTNAANNTKDTTSNKSEAQTASKDHVYGATFDYKTPAKLVDLMKDASKLDTTKDYAVEAVITQVCQKKGCWFNAEDGNGGDIFVKIVSADDNAEEVGIPMTTATGSSLVFYGTPKYREVSVKQQRHYLEDAGKSKAEIDAITKPKMAWRFFATGVVIKG